MAVVVKSEHVYKSKNLFSEFSGNLTRGIVGFYKSVYTNGRGEKVPIATSKFQPTYARRAFPCFDEPSFKSTFTVTLVRPSEGGYIALSNMPVKNEVMSKPGPGFTEVQVGRKIYHFPNGISRKLLNHRRSKNQCQFHQHTLLAHRFQDNDP